MKLRAVSSLFFIASACTAPVCAQLVRIAAMNPPTKQMPASRQIDRKLVPRISVRIYDFDHIEPAAIASAKEVTSEIFRMAGVEALWVECASQERCSTDAGGPEFRVRILPQALGNAMASDHTLGLATPCAPTDQTCLCYVFYWRIRVLADNRADRLLGHVMAHEIGHALLGPNAHDLYGIMQHKLPTGETERTLYFTSAQAKRVRADLLAREAVLNR